MEKFESLLPWYINESLSPTEKLAVEDWLLHDKESASAIEFPRQISKIVASQEIQVPPHQVYKQLSVQIQNTKPAISPFNQWAWGFLMAGILFLFLWILLQPGTQLQWTTAHNDLAGFRIYRAPVNVSSYELISEIPAENKQNNYQFTDSASIPGISYQYIIEVVDRNGDTAISPAVTSNAVGSLGTIFAILLTSIMLTFGMITIVRELKAPLQLDFVN